MMMTMMNLCAAITVFLAVLCTSTAQSNVQLSLNSIIISDNHQILHTDITTTSGITCMGIGSATTRISWILPNGVILTNDGLTQSSNVQLDMPMADTARLLATAGNNPSSFGVYQCRVVFNDGTIIHRKVWIVNNSNAVPAIDTSTSTCSYIGPDTMSQVHGILTTLTVLNGAPTTVSCDLNGRSINQPGMVKINNFESPTSAEISLMSLVSLDITGNPDLTCTVSNSAGSDAFICNLQSKSSKVEIQSISRDSTDSTKATIEWMPLPSSANYTVIVESTDGSDFIRFRDITVHDGRATINGLHPPLSYHASIVADCSGTTSSASGSIMLPSVSEQSTINPFQCQPGYTEKISLKLYYTNNDNIGGPSSCASFSSQDFDNIAYMALSQTDLDIHQNCSVITQDVRCKEKTTNKTPKDHTHSKHTHSKKNYRSKLYIDVEVVCGPCQSGAMTSSSNVTENTPKKDKTPKTPKKDSTPKKNKTPKMDKTPKKSKKDKTPKVKTPTKTPKSIGKRSPSKVSLLFDYNGQEYSGYLSMKTYSIRCANTNNFMEKTKTKSKSKSKSNIITSASLCDCPSECYTGLNKTYKCLDI